MDSIDPDKYYVHERLLLRQLRAVGFDPAVVFDVGSSHGGWSERISKVFPSAEFHLFEPLVDVKPWYRQPCERLIGSGGNFHLHKILLGDANGQCNIVSDKEGYSASALLTGATGNLNEIWPVEMWRLDDFVQRNRLPKPDLIKLDVQGAELLVLSGGQRTLDDVKVVQTEVSFIRAYGPRNPLFHEIIEYLEKRGLKLFELGESAYTERHQLYQCDAFFVHGGLLDSWKGKLPKGPLAIS
jgi:FkbM family methyltransferase